MDESFLDYLKRVTDEIREIQKNSAAESKATGRREYDIVAVNAKQAVVIEIKTKLKAKDVEKFFQTQLPQFKSAFPEFRDHDVYGGMGALVISEEQELELCGLGLFVFTQGEDGIARVRKPANPIIL